jgi:hypothetical protein
MTAIVNDTNTMAKYPNELAERLRHPIYLAPADPALPDFVTMQRERVEAAVEIERLHTALQASESLKIGYLDELAALRAYRALPSEKEIARVIAEQCGSQYSERAARAVLALLGTDQPTYAMACDCLNGARPLPFDRDTLGRLVREAWVRWAQTQPNPKPTWLAPYDDLPEPDKEADRQIGEAIARWALIGDAASRSLTSG